MDSPAVPLKRDPRQEIETLKAFCLDKLPIEDEGKFIEAFDRYYYQRAEDSLQASCETQVARESCRPPGKDTWTPAYSIRIAHGTLHGCMCLQAPPTNHVAPLRRV